MRVGRLHWLVLLMILLGLTVALRTTFLGCGEVSGAAGWSSQCVPMSYGCGSDWCAVEQCSLCGNTYDVSYCIYPIYACNPSFTGCWGHC